MSAPFVSVCVPAYKQVVHLRRTLVSIAEQRFRDFETIITDDSPDGQVEQLVASFADRLPGLKYVRNTDPLGPPANWNQAIALGTAPWVKVMHHDDRFLDADALGTFVRAAEEHGATFICSAARAENETLGTSWLHAPPSSEIDALFRAPHRLLLGNRIGPPSSVMYRRDAGVRFNEAHRFVVDFEFYHDLLVTGAKPLWLAQPLVASISGASHNVTRTSFSREIELRENLELYAAWREQFAPADSTALIDHFTGLFIRYDISTLEEIPEVPGLSNDAILRKAFDRAQFRIRARSLKRRITSSGLYQRLRPSTPVMSKTSYAQCGEDLIMDHVLGALGIKKPFFMDIGAHHPLFLNNTYLFHQRGARGVNIEPDPTLLAAFVDKRPGDVNLNIGISDTPGKHEATLYVFEVPTLNTFSKEEVDRVLAEQPTMKVVATPKIMIENLNDVLARYDADKRIDILSIDVEGLDDQLVRSMDFERHKPLIICLETISYSVSGQGEKNEALIRYVQDQGYLVYADTNINTIFVLDHIWRR